MGETVVKLVFLVRGITRVIGGYNSLVTAVGVAGLFSLGRVCLYEVWGYIRIQIYRGGSWCVRPNMY